jgi:hypothetical protein
MLFLSFPGKRENRSGERDAQFCTMEGAEGEWIGSSKQPQNHGRLNIHLGVPKHKVYDFQKQKIRKSIPFMVETSDRKLQMKISFLSTPII